MPTNEPTATNRLRLVGVWVVHVVLLTAGAVWAADRWQTLQDARELPELRIEPIHVGSLYDRPEIVSDEQLVAVLEKLQPRLRHAKPKINFVDHALRCWGVEAVFDDPDSLSGVELRELLVDHRQFELAWGKSETLVSDGRSRWRSSSYTRRQCHRQSRRSYARLSGRSRHTARLSHPHADR